MTSKFVPCLVCDPELRRDPEIEFLNHLHMQAHAPDEPSDFGEYKEWVAEEYDFDLDHPVFREAGALTMPKVFETYEHLFRDGVEGRRADLGELLCQHPARLREHVDSPAVHAA